MLETPLLWLRKAATAAAAASADGDENENYNETSASHKGPVLQELQSVENLNPYLSSDGS